MNKSLMVVKLYDETEIWAKRWRTRPGGFTLSHTKCVKEGEKPIYIEDEVDVSNDAILVWFRVLRGEKPTKVVRGGPYGPKNTPAA